MAQTLNSALHVVKAARLTPQRRVEIAKKAARARWGKTVAP